jgi:hypothetical protein
VKNGIGNRSFLFSVVGIQGRIQDFLQGGVQLQAGIKKFGLGVGQCAA